MKIAEDLENLDKLLDSSNKSYSDSKSKKSSPEINFTLPSWYFIKCIVFFLAAPFGTADEFYFSALRSG